MPASPDQPDPGAAGPRRAGDHEPPERGAARARAGAGDHEPPDALFAALADGTRRRVLRSVAEHGPVTATALAGHLPVTRQAVAKHLAVLRDAGLVAAERAGRETRFTAATAPLDDLAAWAEAAGRRWDARLDRLRRRLG